MTRKRGRPPKHYQTSWGQIIIGLSLRKSGRFYPTGRSDVSFGSDERLAVHRFRRWEQSNGKLEPLPDLAVSSLGSYLNFRDQIRSMILTDPKQAAIELDIPELANLPPKPDKPQYSLAELGEQYLARKRNKQGRRLDKKHASNAERWWTEFLRLAGVTHAREITSEQVKRYDETILGRFDRGMSPAYVRSRFVQVRAILNWGIQHTEDKIELRRVHDLTAILKAPAETVDPKPVSVADFRKLLDHAQTRERAILLLGLNAAMHNGEVASVKMADIDLKARTLATRRTKTSVPRAATLWARTVKAIRDYLKESPHKSEFLFVSRTGARMNGEAIRQRIVTIRNRAKLPQSVTFEGLRDGAYTVAIAVDAHHAKLLAGHKTGESDKYVLRQADNPKIIACCEAIERHYFDKSQADAEKKSA